MKSCKEKNLGVGADIKNVFLIPRHVGVHVSPKISTDDLNFY